MPITPGTSKAAMATVSIQMTAENNAGQMSGSSMRTSVRHWLTPWTLAASTSARIHAAQGRRDHHVGQRGQRHALHETDSGQRRDIERRVCQAEQLHQENIDHADARMEQKHPTHGLEKSREQDTDAEHTHRHVLYGMSVRSTNQAKINPSGTETAIVIAAKNQRGSPMTR